MKEFEKDALVLIMFSTQSVVGKFQELNKEEKYFSIKNPRLISLAKNPNPNLPPQVLLKDRFYGLPEMVFFRDGDALVIYEVTDPSILTAYLKETTGLTLAQSVPQTKQ